MPSLLTLSIYDLHHIIGRFLRLYRQVQVVSDCLVFACSILCCQCWSMIDDPELELENRPSHEAVMFLPQHVIEARKAGGDPLRKNLFKDFSPQKEDSDEVQEKCIEILKMNTEGKQNACGYISARGRGGEFPTIHSRISHKSTALTLKSSNPRAPTRNS